MHSPAQVPSSTGRPLEEGLDLVPRTEPKPHFTREPKKLPHLESSKMPLAQDESPMFAVCTF